MPVTAIYANLIQIHLLRNIIKTNLTYRLIPKIFQKWEQ